MLKFTTNPQTSWQSNILTIRPTMGRTVMVTVNIYLSFCTLYGEYFAKILNYLNYIIILNARGNNVATRNESSFTLCVSNPHHFEKRAKSMYQPISQKMFSFHHFTFSHFLFTPPFVRDLKFFIKPRRIFLFINIRIVRHQSGQDLRKYMETRNIHKYLNFPMGS